MYLIVFALGISITDSQGRELVGGQATENVVRVLMVHSYSYDYPWTSGQQEGFIQTLDQLVSSPLEFKSEFLDTKRKK